MVSLANFAAAFGAVLFLLSRDGATATSISRKPASPSYSSANVCPGRYGVSGPSTGNWSVYPNFNKIQKCPKTMFYDFSLYDQVDNKDENHRIQACSSFGTDFASFPVESVQLASAESHNVEFEIGWWKEGYGLAAAEIKSLVKQSGQATIGLYIGQGLLNEAIGESALKIFQDNLEHLNVSTTTLAMQLCGSGYGSTYIFGIMATSNGTFTPIQGAIKSWANGTCLSFSGSTKFPGPAKFTTPLLHSNRTLATTNSTIVSNSAIHARAHHRHSIIHARALHRRAECRIVQVDPNTGCPEAAQKCGISASDFTKYNPGNEFCMNLKPKQHNGCGPLYKDTVICLSEGTAPFPAPIANAICGPQKPGSEPPTNDSNIAEMNPCPLNAYALQIDTSLYSHIHFGFGTLTADYQVEVGDVLLTYQFHEFQKISGAKWILSFGSWKFSNSDATYKIFRTGVRPETWLTMVTNIANFIKEHDLDGVDIDWEYPGAPDLRVYDPGTEDEGPNYLAFLVYLKQFPIEQISKILDYIVYMTYDLHGCETGLCLRSQVNLTETKQSLAMITKAGVPGEKVIIRVTSYGRSFKMASPGCWGPNCQFTGDRLSSNAMKGECIDTAGAATKKTRINLYTAWGLGETSDWATNLQSFHAVPAPQTKWAMFIKLASNGEDPKTDHSRNSNWTDFDCNHEVIGDNGVNTDAAWADVVLNFTQSVSSTLWIGDQANCGSKIQDSCDAISCLAPLDHELSGPAGQFIWNSLAAIHKLFTDYDDYLWKAATTLSLQIDHLTNKFAPLPEKDDDVWKDLLTNLLVLGGVGTAGPLISKVLSQLPWFNQDSRGETTQSVAMTVLEQGIMDQFSAYMGQVISGWLIFNSYSLSALLDEGSNAAIDAIWDLISDGKLIEGKFENKPPAERDLAGELQDNILKCVFGFTIPALWRSAGTYPFILKTGTGCGVDHYLEEMEEYLDEETMKETGECVKEEQWYLVYPKGDSEDCSCQVNDGGPCNEQCVPAKFSAPPGLDSLNGTFFGSISKKDLIAGSVNTWRDNNEENTYKYADPTDPDTVRNLMNVDVTTAGYMHIPVCSATRAYQSWDSTSMGSSEFYPCDLPPGKDYCEQATFEDQTSDASPDLEDCRTIIRNIQGDGGTDFTHQVVGTPHREILVFGSCHFGIEAISANGNVEFYVGGQDVIDIINDAIAKFGNSNGKIGTKGLMNCNGNTRKQGVEWGIY
ncbi:hypothetical protein BJX70DRAFT_392853 [Aspergillus crustosus]